MTFKSKFISGVIIFFTLAAAAGTGFYIKSPELFNCLTVNFSGDFSELKENLFISNDTPRLLKDSIISVLEKADKRVCKFWNTSVRSGNPVFIFCCSKNILSSYNKNNRIATYKTPFKCYVVFYKDCIDPDMLSHELLHTELCSRTGFFRNLDLPVWFDEGLAMQVDYRKEYSEEKYNELKDSIKMKIDLSRISEPADFYSGNFYYHFILAKHEVSEWLKDISRQDLDNFFDSIEEGKDFSSLYGRRNL